jgi:GTP cyclohydrolase II
MSAEVEPQESFAEYVRTKQEKMGHIVDSVETEA